MERKIHFGENWLIFLGIWGEAELILIRIWVASEEFFQGAEEFSQGFGEINASMEHRPGGLSIAETIYPDI